MIAIHSGLEKYSHYNHFVFPPLSHCGWPNQPHKNRHGMTMGEWHCPACPSHTCPFGVQHFNEQIVTGHLTTQVHVAQVVLGLHAEGAHLCQRNQQLAELFLELRVGCQGILQKSSIHLLLDPLHKGLVLQHLYICKQKE